MTVQTVSDRIKDIITKMIFKDSYWGYLFSKINRAEDLSLEAPMGVSPEIDGTITLLYNPEFIKLGSDEFLKAVIEHEGTHILNQHIPRLLRIISDEVDKEKKSEKILKWNYASDCAVNTIIDIKKGYSVGGKDFKPIFPEFYGLPNKKSSEYYYENIPNDKLPKMVHMHVSGDGDGKENNSKNNGNIDDHKSWMKNISKVSDISALASRLQQYTEAALEESYNNVRNKGNLPNFISEKIQELLKPPQIPYYQMIAKLVKGSRLSKQKRAYTRINKKRVYSFFLSQSHLPVISPFPGKTKDFSFNISIVLDTSGSMGIDDIMEGLSGVKSIIENDKYCCTTVIEADTVIHKEYQIKRLKDICYDIHGRGGTELFPAINRCKELNTDITLVFTDGYCDNINGFNRMLLPRKIVYVLTCDGNSNTLDQTGYIVRLPEESRSRRRYY